MKLHANAVTHVGRTRGHNEDVVFAAPELGLFAVCDGMGGHHAGDVAAATTVKIVETAIRRQHAQLEAASDPDPGRVLAVMRGAVEEASQEVYRLARTTGGRHGMGSTCTVLLVLGGKGFMAHVGDSRLYLARDHRLYQLSDDHTYMREAIRMGMMTDEQARNSKFANVVTRGVGVARSVCVDTLTFDVVAGDRFLLCSDGLHRYGEQHPGALVEHLDLPPGQATAELVNFANEAGGDDNIGVVVVHADVPDEQAAPLEQRRRIDLNENLGALGHVALFADLSMKQMVDALNGFEVADCEAGEVIIREGETSETLFIVVSGELEVTRGGKPLARLGAGSHFGEMALLSRRPRSATVQATTPVRLLVQERQNFLDLVTRDPSIGLKFMWQLSHSLSIRLDDAYALGSAGGEQSPPSPFADR